MTDTLHRMILGAIDEHGTIGLLASSGDLGADEMTQWRDMIALAPPPEPDSEPALGVFNGPGRNFLLGLARLHDAHPLYAYVLLPRRLTQQIAGHIDALLDLADPALPGDDEAVLAPIEAPSIAPWSAAERADHIAIALGLLNGDMALLRALLAAALDARLLLICGFTGDVGDRLALVQGLLALLPAPARFEITFATHADAFPAAHPRIIFADESVETGRWLADLHADSPLGDVRPATDYTDLLGELWDGDPAALIAALDRAEAYAEALLPAEQVSLALDALARQVRLDRRALAGEALDPQIIKTVLSAGLPLPHDALRAYSERLIEHALDARDTEAALLVSLQMDADPALDADFGAVLNQHLETQPDSVYVFVRTRLNDAMESPAHWIDRLRAAALASLRVAIADADAVTIADWLRLIAREPAAYGLGDVLEQSILAAQGRAHEDGELARLLLLLAVKHAPTVLDTLLGDDVLLSMVPENLGLVLRDFRGEPMVTLRKRGPEMFLVAMGRSARARAAAHFTAEVNAEIWKLYTSGASFNLPEVYQPAHIIELWVNHGVEWLPPATIQHLLTLMLADERDEMFYRLAERLAARDQLKTMLIPALQNSQRGVEDLLTIVTQLTARKQISQQDAADAYIGLLALREWRQAALPMVEQLTRLSQQNPALNIPPRAIWSLLDVAAKARSDAIARMAARQLFNDLEEEPNDDDAPLVDRLGRLFDQIAWSAGTRIYALNWWRDYIRRQPTPRLTRLDKDLDGRRALEDAHHILETTLAFRRMLGQRTLEEFADALNTAFSVLEDIAESFEPTPKRPITFDADTIRAELAARESDLSADQARILAKNLKELAQLIGEMGDQRSKANIMRRGDNIDRQLITGEQQPASAVDVMKWMSGYLDGLQGRAEKSDE